MDRGTERGQAFLDTRAAAKRIEARPDGVVPKGNTVRHTESPSHHCHKVDLIRADTLKPKPINWLWLGWLAAGKMHILGGAPGTGKTTIAMALAATLTVGGKWPDGTQARQGRVAIWSGEDDAQDTLVPRLLASGADTRSVHFIGSTSTQEGTEKRPFDPATDAEALRRELQELGDVRLLIVDPIVSAITGDSHKNAEVRRGLQPMSDLAASLDCALLGITHFSKGTMGRDPVERVTGSLAFGAMARIVMVTAKQQQEAGDGQAGRILCRAKSNIGVDVGGFRYDLHQSGLEAYPGVTASHVLWGEAVEGTARELLATADATDDGEGGALAEAKQFLRDLLADGAHPAKDIETEAKDNGIAWRTVRRAADSLNVNKTRDGFQGRSIWSLTPDLSKKPIDAQHTETGKYGKYGQVREDDHKGEQPVQLDGLRDADQSNTHVTYLPNGQVSVEI